MTVLAATLTDQTRGALPVLDFDALYHAHVATTWRVLQRLGVPERHLEDATQDTFIIAHRQLPTFRGGSTLKTWLHGIAVRVAKDYRRRETRKGGWEPLSPGLEDGGRSPHDAAEGRQALDLVLELLDGLDEAQRTVFVLVEFEGLTAPEVAEVTESNVNTVSTRLRAARQKFNALVEAKGGIR
ncbi:MAG: RNA polymerase sigma factor [Myxococcaceae bacterium]|nr:RNA polymerase sigma factor [Myxococcaceae bacterium]